MRLGSKNTSVQPPFSLLSSCREAQHSRRRKRPATVVQAAARAGHAVSNHGHWQLPPPLPGRDPKRLTLAVQGKHSTSPWCGRQGLLSSGERCEGNGGQWRALLPRQARCSSMGLGFLACPALLEVCTMLCGCADLETRAACRPAGRLPQQAAPHILLHSPACPPVAASRATDAVTVQLLSVHFFTSLVCVSQLVAIAAVAQHK